MPLAQQFEQLWDSAAVPPDIFSFLKQQKPADSQQWLAVLLADQLRRWKTDSPWTRAEYEASGQKINIEQYSPTLDHPMAAPSWYDSVQYCRWLGGQTGASRVSRGGSWDNDAANCRTANRNNDTPTNRNTNNGFRLALNSAGKRWMPRDSGRNRSFSRLTTRNLGQQNLTPRPRGAGRLGWMTVSNAPRGFFTAN